MSKAKQEMGVGTLIATTPGGSKLYRVEDGPDGGMVQIETPDGRRLGKVKLARLLAHSPYWTPVETRD